MRPQAVPACSKLSTPHQHDITLCIPVTASEGPGAEPVTAPGDRERNRAVRRVCDVHVPNGGWWCAPFLRTGPLSICSGESSVQVLGPMLSWVVCLFGIEWRVLFICSGCTSLLRRVICAHWLLVHRLSFHFPGGLFSGTV